MGAGIRNSTKSKKPTKLKDMVMDEKAAKGSKGVQVIVRYLRPFYSKHSRVVFVATLDLSTFEQPQAYGKDLPATCSVQHVKQSPAKPQSESSPVNIVHLRDTAQAHSQRDTTP